MRQRITRIIRATVRRSGQYFDSHFIIGQLIKRYPNDYFRFISDFVGGTRRGTLAAAHGKIAQEIGQTGLAVKSGDSVSVDICGNPAKCALWRRT